jgi:hypothetical protein
MRSLRMMQRTFHPYICGISRINRSHDVYICSRFVFKSLSLLNPTLQLQCVDIVDIRKSMTKVENTKGCVILNMKICNVDPRFLLFVLFEVI